MCITIAAKQKWTKNTFVFSLQESERNKSATNERNEVKKKTATNYCVSNATNLTARWSLDIELWINYKINVRFECIFFVYFCCTKENKQTIKKYTKNRMRMSSARQNQHFSKNTASIFCKIFSRILKYIVTKSKKVSLLDNGLLKSF